MGAPEKDDEALVDAVASVEWERGRARGMYADMSWQEFRQINEQKDGLLDTVEKPLLANARAAIAAVRAYDASAAETKGENH